MSVTHIILPRERPFLTIRKHLPSPSRRSAELHGYPTMLILNSTQITWFVAETFSPFGFEII